MDKKATDASIVEVNMELSDHLFGDIRLFDLSDVMTMVSMENAIKLMEEAYASFSSGKSYVPSVIYLI